MKPAACLRSPIAAPSSNANEECCEVRTLQVEGDEFIQMTLGKDFAFGELIRDGVVVASARFASQDALGRWAVAILDRAARNNARSASRQTGCINCDD